MGCDIHLYLEKRCRRFEQNGWSPCSFDGEFSERIYGMFAALNNVRNYREMEHLVDRGLPADIAWKTFSGYYNRVLSKDEIKKGISGYSEEDAKRWEEEGSSTIINKNGFNYCSDPDWHSPNWCTTKEMEMCFRRVFMKENGGFIEHADYEEWLALLAYMKAIEISGQYECRAVFWFDN